MIRKLGLLFLVLGVVGMASALELFTFRAFAVVDHCQLEWATGTEGGLSVFIVERSSDGTTYMPIGRVTAQGSYSQYQFTDSSPLDADVDRTFYYRLKMVSRDGNSSYSPVEEVSLSFTPVQHTWGMIKALFR